MEEHRPFLYQEDFLLALGQPRLRPVLGSLFARLCGIPRNRAGVLINRMPNLGHYPVVYMRRKPRDIVGRRVWLRHADRYCERMLAFLKEVCRRWTGYSTAIYRRSDRGRMPYDMNNMILRYHQNDLWDLKRMILIHVHGVNLHLFGAALRSFYYNYYD